MLFLYFSVFPQIMDLPIDNQKVFNLFNESKKCRKTTVKRLQSLLGNQQPLTEKNLDVKVKRMLDRGHQLRFPKVKHLKAAFFSEVFLAP